MSNCAVNVATQVNDVSVATQVNEVSVTRQMNAVSVVQQTNAVSVQSAVNQVSVTMSGSGSKTFLGLVDTPNSYTSEALKVTRVNAAENALEFVTLTTVLDPIYLRLDTANDPLTGDLNMGGNVLFGDTISSGNLLIESTSHATKGLIGFTSLTQGLIWNEDKKSLAIGDASFSMTVGGVTKDNAFTVHNSGGANAYDVVFHRHSNTSGPFLAGARARGSESSPSIVQDGDNLLDIFGVGYDGIDYEFAASIMMDVDGTPGSGDMPGRIILSTTPSGSGTPVERMRITSAGLMGINVIPTSGRLEINAATATNQALILKTTDDNFTKNVFEVKNSIDTNLSTFDFQGNLNLSGATAQGTGTVDAVPTLQFNALTFTEGALTFVSGFQPVLEGTETTFTLVRSDPSFALFGGGVSADTFRRYILSAGGKMSFGTGGAATDSFIERSTFGGADGGILVTNTGPEDVNFTLKLAPSQTNSAMRIKDASGNVLIDFTLGGAVFNEQGAAAVVFRIEGDTDENLFFVDASTDRVGIGTNTPDKLFEVNGKAQFLDQIEIRAAGTHFVLKDTGTGSKQWNFGVAGGQFRITENGVSQHFTITPGGNIGIGTGSTEPTHRVHINMEDSTPLLVAGEGTPSITNTLKAYSGDATDGTVNYIDLYSSGGTAATPASSFGSDATVTNATISLRQTGYGSGTELFTGARIDFVYGGVGGNGSWGAGGTSSQIEFYTTAVNSTTPVLRQQIRPNGDIYFNGGTATIKVDGTITTVQDLLISSGKVFGYNTGATIVGFMPSDGGVNYGLLSHIKNFRIDIDSDNNATTHHFMVGHNSNHVGFLNSGLFSVWESGGVLIEDGTHVDPTGAMFTVVNNSNKIVQILKANVTQIVNLKEDRNNSDIAVNYTKGDFTVVTGSGRIKNTIEIDHTDSPYTILSTDHHVSVDSDGGAVTINLPAGITGSEYFIYNVGSSGNNVSIIPNGLELLLGVNSGYDILDGGDEQINYFNTQGWR